jgi:hypothetical protein
MEPVSATVSAALASLRLAKEMAKNLKQTDISEKLQEVYDLVADMRHQIFNLEDESRRLQRENEQLRDDKEVEKQLVFEQGVYWRVVNGKRDGPFCPYCRDADKKLVHTENLGGGTRWCDIHKRYF